MKVHFRKKRAALRKTAALWNLKGEEIRVRPKGRGRFPARNTVTMQKCLFIFGPGWEVLDGDL